MPSPLPQHLVKQVYEADLKASRSKQQAEEERLRAEEKRWLTEEAWQKAEEIRLWTEWGCMLKKNFSKHAKRLTELKLLPSLF